MKSEVEKRIGQVVTIIYENRNHGYTKRRIKPLAVEGNALRAYCLERMAPRTFLLQSVLAIEPYAPAKRPMRARGEEGGVRAMRR